MANPFVQYLKDTRSELNHVAWPTQQQTAVFTTLVVAVSLGIAAYVGVLDYGFRDALLGAVNVSGNINAKNAVQTTQPTSTTTSTQPAPSFAIPGATTPTPAPTPQTQTKTTK